MNQDMVFFIMILFFIIFSKNFYQVWRTKLDTTYQQDYPNDFILITDVVFKFLEIAKNLLNFYLAFWRIYKK